LPPSQANQRTIKASEGVNMEADLALSTEPYGAAPPERPQQALSLLPRITALRLRYLRSGYTPLPCTGKVPAPRGWESMKVDAAQVSSWGMLYRQALNIGIRTQYTPAVDIDVYDADMVRIIEAALLKYLPQDKAILRRVGQAPKRLIPFQCLTPFKKCAIKFTSPDGTSHKVEVLCDGQQFISEGWHPDTGEPYAWMGDKLVDILPTRLPQLNEAIAHKFLADVQRVVIAKGWTVSGVKEKAATSEQPKAATASANGSGRGRNEAYAGAALDHECEAVANATKGSRNDALNRAAFSLFQLVAGGELDESEVEERLFDAATCCGLVQEDGADSVRATIASGAKAGRGEPRRAPEQDGDCHFDNARQSPPHEGEGDPQPGEQPNSKTNGSGPHTDTNGNGSGPHTDGSSPPPPPGKRVELVHANTIEQRPIEWLWKPRLARGKIALIAGDPGVGKSSVIADIVARSSAARMWPDTGFAPCGNCIILSAEDAADDTICPRLEVAGADMSRVFLMRMAGKPGTKLTFSLSQDLPLLTAAIERLGSVILLAIDPITAYLGDKVDTHQTAAVRAVLEPLDAFAAHHRCSILGVTHPPKAAQSKAINAFTGSLAFVAASRTAFVAVEESETDRRLLLAVKSNIGPAAPGIAYRLEPVGTAKGIEAIRVQWDAEPVNITANEAIYASAEGAKGSGHKREAEEFLQAYLEAGPMPADKVTAAAEANGISDRTLKRAKKTLRVVSEKDEFRGGWTWRLPR
jgi:putative DNA primase/helicase